jgi:hypothetical protein
MNMKTIIAFFTTLCLSTNSFAVVALALSKNQLTGVAGATTLTGGAILADGLTLGIGAKIGTALGLSVEAAGFGSIVLGATLGIAGIVFLENNKANIRFTELTTEEGGAFGNPDQIEVYNSSLYVINAVQELASTARTPYEAQLIWQAEISDGNIPNEAVPVIAQVSANFLKHLAAK